MSTKDKNRTCQHVDEGGKPCKRAMAPDSMMCRQHTPGYAEDLRKRAQARFEEQLVEHNAQMLLKKTELGQEVEHLKALHKHEFYWLEQQRNQAQALLDEVKRAKEVVAKMASLERLEEIYQTARASGDAATMHEVNKSMYYAKKKVGLD